MSHFPLKGCFCLIIFNNQMLYKVVQVMNGSVLTNKQIEKCGLCIWWITLNTSSSIEQFSIPVAFFFWIFENAFFFINYQWYFFRINKEWARDKMPWIDEWLTGFLVLELQNKRWEIQWKIRQNVKWYFCLCIFFEIFNYFFFC